MLIGALLMMRDGRRDRRAAGATAPVRTVRAPLRIGQHPMSTIVLCPAVLLSLALLGAASVDRENPAGLAAAADSASNPTPKQSLDPAAPTKSPFRHRLLPGPPSDADLQALKAAGIDVLIDFQHPAEKPQRDEAAAARDAGIEYLSLPYAGASQLTDELLDAARAALCAADAQGRQVALHCRSGNRVMPVWAAYRAVDLGLPLSDALKEAREALGLPQGPDPLLESRMRDYVRRRLAPEAAWRVVTVEELPPAQVEARARAVAARDSMFGRLFAALAEAMSRPGPDGQPAGAAGAIEVCRTEAPRIAREVAAERQLMIGRTGLKLRNPTNAPPAWAAPLLARLSESDESGAVASAQLVHPDGSLGVLLPIKLLSNCLVCHGPQEQIEPRVREVLVKSYPDDRATGFREGDLRGWFWVEIAPSEGAEVPEARERRAPEGS